MAATLVTVDTARLGFTSAAIQAAVDCAAATPGCTVRIPAGEYRMHDAVHLRSGIDLLGVGDVRLVRAPSVSSPLAFYIGYGHYEFTVVEPEKFEVGMGIHITDDNAAGFYETVARIIDRDGDRFFIDEPLSHDYHPTRNGRVTAVSSLVKGRDVSQVRIGNLILDGNAGENAHLGGCRGGGIFLIGCADIELERVSVGHYHGDGVSFQQCRDIRIRQCHVHDNTGGGIHPGSGSVRYQILDNTIERNGGCGIFYCLRTCYSDCVRNRISDNGSFGISIGERDMHHLISGNLIRGNRDCGIAFRQPLAQSGDHVLLQENELADNGGVAPIHVPAGLRQIWMDANRIGGDGVAVKVEPGCEAIHITGLPADRVDDVGGCVTFAVPETPPTVGMDAPGGADERHLGRR